MMTRRNVNILCCSAVDNREGGEPRNKGRPFISPILFFMSLTMTWANLEIKRMEIMEKITHARVYLYIQAHILLLYISRRIGMNAQTCINEWVLLLWIVIFPSERNNHAFSITSQTPSVHTRYTL